MVRNDEQTHEGFFSLWFALTGRAHYKFREIEEDKKFIRDLIYDESQA
jgi:hypothetical protein